MRPLAKLEELCADAIRAFEAQGPAWDLSLLSDEEFSQLERLRAIATGALAPEREAAPERSVRAHYADELVEVLDRLAPEADPPSSYSALSFADLSAEDREALCTAVAWLVRPFQVLHIARPERAGWVFAPSGAPGNGAEGKNSSGGGEGTGEMDSPAGGGGAAILKLRPWQQ